MKRSIGVAAALIAATGAWAADPPAGGLLYENILSPLPTGFKVGFQVRKPEMGMVEMVPVSETVENWSRIATQQTFFRTPNADPDAVPKQMASGWKSACPGGTTEALSHDAENGYRSALWRFVCPLNPATKKPEIMWMKVIAGGDALYSMQYAFRRAPSEAASSEALAYLKTVTVCDTRKPDHPCPKLTPVR